MVPGKKAKKNPKPEPKKDPKTILNRSGDETSILDGQGTEKP
jgi:hypothetical protein